jgi:NADH dehydrogenase
MTDVDSLARAVEGVDAVVHLVAIITGKPEEFEQVMTRGTETLVSAAERPACDRFVLMSALGRASPRESSRLTSGRNGRWSSVFRRRRSSTRSSGQASSSAGRGRPSDLPAPRPVLARDAVVGPGTQRIQPIWVDDVATYFAKSSTSWAPRAARSRSEAPTSSLGRALLAYRDAARQAAPQAARAVRPHARPGKGDRRDSGAEPDHA